MFGLTARRVSRPAAAAAQTRCLGVVRARLDDLAAHRGETEVLQYEGMKWTIGDVKRYADAFASGVGELAVAPGDAVDLSVAVRDSEVVVLSAARRSGGGE